MTSYYYDDTDEFEDDCGYSTPGWYFWDEAFSSIQGPFVTKEECQTALKKYAMKDTI